MLTIQLTETQSILAYNGLMLLAALAAICFYYFEGRRRQFPMGRWLSAVAVMIGLMTVGSRLGAFSGADWLAFFQGGALPEHAQKTALGGLLLALPAYWLLRKRLGLPGSAADALFMGLPLAAIIGRAGCAMAGCCFGTPSEAPWAWQYGTHAAVYRWQQAQGMIAPDAVLSQSVHPVQLYMILGNVLIFAALWYLRPRLRRTGSLALLTVSLMMGNRFVLEFFREQITNRGLTGHIWLGLKAAQWIALLLCIGGGIWLLWRERKTRPTAPSVFADIPPARQSAWLLGMALMAWAARPWLTLMEEGLIILAFIPAFVHLMADIWARRKSSTGAWSVGMLSATMLLLADLPRDSMQPGQPAPRWLGAKQDKPERWIEIGAGGSFGKAHDIDRDCGGNVVYDREIQHRSAGIDLSAHIRTRDGGDISLGLRGGSGFARELEPPRFSAGPLRSTRFYWVSPNVHFNLRPIGFSIGVLNTPIFDKNFLPGLPETRLKFSGGIRLGLAHRYYFDIQYLNMHGFSYYPYPVASVGLFNYGFNDQSGRSLLRLGVAVMSERPAGLIGIRFPFKNPNLYSDLSLSVGRDFVLSAGLRYRIPVEQRY